METQNQRLNRVRSNNEYYIKLFHEIETVKCIYITKHLNTLENIIDFIKRKNVHLITKVDRRTVKHTSIEKMFNEIKTYEELLLQYENENDENDLKIKKIKSKIIDIKNTIVDTYYFSYYVVKNSKDKALIDLIELQNFYLDQMIFMNYPYVFQEITKYAKGKSIYRNNLKDIENTTIEIIMSAIIKYDLTKEVKLVTYLTNWIKYGIEEETSRIIKDIKIKYNDLTPMNYRFIAKDFINKQFDILINKEKDKLVNGLKIKERREINDYINELKLKKKNSYFDCIQNLKNKNCNFFEIFDFYITENTPLKEVILYLNKIIATKPNREILYDFFQENQSKLLHELSQNFSTKKEILYHMILMLMNDNEEIEKKNVQPIDEIDNFHYHTHDIEFNSIVFSKLYDLLDPHNANILKQFELTEIDNLPNETKKIIKKVLISTNLIEDLKDMKELNNF